jgi:phosphate starvation-inducible PhoH-like protein
MTKRKSKVVSCKKKRQSQPTPPPAAMPSLSHTVPINRQQSAALEVVRNNAISYLVGPAGTGKTHVAAIHAVQQFLDKKIKHIVIARPIVEAGESLGFLPGDFEAKASPYLKPIFDVVDRMCGGHTNLRALVQSALIIAPIAYMRGRTFHNSVVLLDEAQNCKQQQLKLVGSRIAQSSQAIYTGDLGQSDLEKRYQAFGEHLERVAGLDGVGIFQFDSKGIVRHPILESWLGRLES